MKILVTGAAGQLGRDCVKVLEESHQVTPLGSKDLDIADDKSVIVFFRREKPDVIVNCAAFTRVDECETKRELAWRVNVEGPKNLAAAAGKNGARLIHISTDYVFDGKKPVPQAYTEQDEAGPISHYGATKLAAEKAVARETDCFAILRTAWMYGVQGRNFLKTMLRLALADPSRNIRVVNDQFGSPTWSLSLARQIEKVMDARLNGIFHATSEGYCTWYELARSFLKEMAVPHAVVPCSTAEYPTPAARPANSILENRRLKEAGQNVMADWRDDLVRFTGLFRDRLMNEVKA
jgi:dTDP-4-dehydrorhamnose reductase